MPNTATTSDELAELITIPGQVFDLAARSNEFFQGINGDSAEMHARDSLDISRAVKHAELLQRFAPLEGARVLEIGSGFGANVAVWIKAYGADVYGIEPSAPEWGASFEASRILMSANDIDPDRITSAFGENLPFEDNSFDIVYSSNVLEHVQDPERVVQEAIRVLKPGGVLHFEFPNFLSYFESHYVIFQPPIFNRTMLALWVRLRGKDPAFAKTINTINPIWCRRVVSRLRKRYPVSVITLGQDIFLERLAQPWRFQTEQAEAMRAAIVSAIQAVNCWNWIGRLIVAAQGFYPIFLTLRKEKV
jgi:ubiquinone/menaquinone biosynthesis C-methylase UbiE